MQQEANDWTISSNSTSPVFLPIWINKFYLKKKIVYFRDQRLITILSLKLANSRVWLSEVRWQSVRGSTWWNVPGWWRTQGCSKDLSYWSRKKRKAIAFCGMTFCSTWENKTLDDTLKQCLNVRDCVCVAKVPQTVWYMKAALQMGTNSIRELQKECESH